MPREVNDPEGVRWSCVQAYAGLGEPEDAAVEAAQVEGETDRFRVVCTPSGGARTLELELPGGWEESMSDEALLAEIRRNGSGRGG